MHIVGGKVHEEGGASLLLNEVDGMSGDAVGNVLIFPKGFAAALHVADTADAVDDGVVVPVRALEVV